MGASHNAADAEGSGQFVERNTDLIREVAAACAREADAEDAEYAREQLDVEWGSFETNHVFGDGETVCCDQVDPDVLDAIERGDMTVEQAAKEQMQSAFEGGNVIAEAGEVESEIRHALELREMDREDD